MEGENSFFCTSLEQRFGQKVEVTSLFSYLEAIASQFSAQQQQEERKTFHDAFINEWKHCLNKTGIITYSGTWAPHCLGPQDLRKQQPWRTFIKKYEPSFEESNVINSKRSPEFQPLNFKEQIHLTFWKELYESFGYQVLHHIFEKSAVLYEIEDGLFLLVAYSGSFMYKRMLNNDGSSTQLPKSKTQKKLPVNPKRTLEQEQRRTTTINPYKSSLNDSVKIMSKPSNNSDLAISKKRKTMEADLLSSSDTRAPPPPQPKRIKLAAPLLVLKSNIPSPGPSLPDNLKSNIPSPGPSLPDNTQQHQKNDNDNDKREQVKDIPMRWLKPKPIDLKNLIEHRSSLLASQLRNRQGKASSSTATATDTAGENDLKIDESSLHFVRIHKDEEFPAKDKLFVLKQTRKVSATSPILPAEWEGLKLPDNLNLKAMSKGNDFVQANAYFISETLALKLGIRLKPKGRGNRRGRGKNPHIEASTNPSPLSTNSGAGAIVVHPPDSCNTARKEADDKEPIIPYESDIMLPIASCLYNRSSWSHWPVEHDLSKAVNVFPKDKAMAATILVRSIMDIKISSDLAYQHLLDVSVKDWPNPSHDASFPLNKMILDVIEAHTKHKHLHRLVKSCSKHWRLKYQQKMIRKNKNKKPSGSGALKKLVEPGPGPGPTGNVAPSLPDLPSASILAPGMEMEKDDSSEESSVIVLSDAPDSTTEENQKKTPTTANGSGDGCSGKSRNSAGSKRLEDNFPFNSVSQTLKQIFHALKLEKLLGSKRNLRGFFKFVRKSIMLGGTKSSLHLGELMAFIHAEETPFFQACGSDLLATETVVAKLVTWLFNEYVLILLKTSFYITECNDTRNHVKFFIREDWISASHKAKKALLRNGALKKRQKQQQRQEFTPTKIIMKGRLRYMPKRNNTLRPLLIKKKEAWGTVEDNRMFLMLLRYIDAKLNKSLRQLPNTFQNGWRKFIKEWKELGSPKLFYLRMDIKDAYPSVSQERLNELLCNIVGGRKNKLDLMEKQYVICNGSSKRVFKYSVFDPSNRDNWHSGIQSRPCIVMDVNREDKKIDAWETLDRITAMISSSTILKIGKKSYDFSHGLPQGWGLSSTLCNIYYGHIDSTLYLPFQTKPGRFFLRIVDDYLFVTPRASEIQNFIQISKIGCDEYKIKMNEEKSETNIFVRTDALAPEDLCEVTTFCGWNVCFTCGHISRNYEKYAGQNFCSTVSFQMLKRAKTPEEFIRLRGTLIMPVRLKSILMDLSINCPKRVLLTTYEAAVLLGFRFYAICKVVYPNLNAIKEPERAVSLVQSIKLCCRRLAGYVSKNSRTSSPIHLDSSLPKLITSCGEGSCCGAGAGPRESDKDSSKDLLNFDALLYTSLCGFRMKLLEHTGVFNDGILPKIDRTINSLKKKLDAGQCDGILHIVGKKLPVCFRTITV